MDKSMMKIVITVMVISMLLLVGSVCALMYSGDIMMKSVGTSEQTDQSK